MGTATGLIMSIIIILTWIIFEDSINLEEMINTLNSKGLSNVNLYVLGMIYWIFINSLLEEYVFRWFLVEKGEVLFGPGWTTISLSAAIFVLHHFFALWFLGFSLSANLLACAGLFIGGAAFSWLYVRYRSIWIPYITHALCDIVVFGVGYMLLFS